MKINNKHRKWIWAKKIIRKFGAAREMSILQGGDLTMNLLGDDIVVVESDIGTCMVYILEYNESACFICG